MPLAVGAGISIATALVCIGVSEATHPGYLNWGWKIIVIAVITFAGICISVKIPHNINRKMCCLLICISVISGCYVRPVSRGIDAITSKPVGKEIEKIVQNDLDGKWIAVGGEIFLPGYAIACGAPTINAVNTYPNLELWRKLDPEGIYEKKYNRYVHIDVKFTKKNTTFKLKEDDRMILNLSYKDMKKMEVKYILSIGKRNVDNGFVKFDQVYGLDDCYIYKVQYKGSEKVNNSK